MGDLYVIRNILLDNGSNNDLTITKKDMQNNKLSQINFGSDSTNLNGEISFKTIEPGSDNLVERMRVHTNGNVGIGTSSPVTNSKLDISGGGLNIGGVENLEASIHIKSSYGGHNRLLQMSPTGPSKPGLNLLASTNAASKPQWWVWGVDNDNKWKLQSGTSFSGTTGLFVDSSGKVGIGVNPDAKLDLLFDSPSGFNKAVEFEYTGAGASDFDIVRNSSQNSQAKRIFRIRGGNDFDNTFTSFSLGMVSYHPLRFMTNNTERIRITAGGNVGIGWTSPGGKLCINGGLHVGGDSNPGNANLMVDGNVGIGGSAIPTRKLEIGGSSGNILWAGASTGSTANIDLSGHVQLREYSNWGFAYLQARDDNSNRDIALRIRTQAAGASKPIITEALTIDKNGYVGIGVTPTSISGRWAKLNVDGPVNCKAHGHNIMITDFIHWKNWVGANFYALEYFIDGNYFYVGMNGPYTGPQTSI